MPNPEGASLLSGSGNEGWKVGWGEMQQASEDGQIPAPGFCEFLCVLINPPLLKLVWMDFTPRDRTIPKKVLFCHLCARDVR